MAGPTGPALSACQPVSGCPGGGPAPTTAPADERLIPMGMISPSQRHEGESVTVNIALSMVGASHPTLSGTVEIVVDDSIRGTVTLKPDAGQGTATWTVELPHGVHRMRAAYSGNEFYQSVGFSSGLTIQNGRLEVTPPEQIAAGPPYTVQVKVVPINGATGTRPERCACPTDSGPTRRRPPSTEPAAPP
ncbi:Ig-like domain-containing protein [Parafrankia colletiae]|nr:Ig-like domain-containing protein [Parafrankia colletiae]